MRGPKPTHPIALTAEEAKQLQQLIRAHTTPQALAVRARIILTANTHPEQNNQQIASTSATTDRTVRKWRARWVATRSLADASRSGAPRRVGPTCGPRSHAASHLGQHGGSLAQSRASSPVALSRLAAHP